MKIDPPIDRLKKILEENEYMCLGTSSNNVPWVAPLYFAYDNKYCLFFVSPVHTLHHNHIQCNEHVSIAIYDSTAEVGHGDGIQLEGKASVVETSVVRHAAEVIFSRRFSDETQRAKYLNSKRYTGDSPLRLFRVEPISWFVTDFSSKLDRRIEVDMSDK